MWDNLWAGRVFYFTQTAAERRQTQDGWLLYCQQCVWTWHHPVVFCSLYIWTPPAVTIETTCRVATAARFQPFHMKHRTTIFRSERTQTDHWQEVPDAQTSPSEPPCSLYIHSIYQRPLTSIRSDCLTYRRSGNARARLTISSWTLAGSCRRRISARQSSNSPSHRDSLHP